MSTTRMNTIIAVVAAALMSAIFTVSGAAHESDDRADIPTTNQPMPVSHEHMAGSGMNMGRLIVPEMSPERGMELFVSTGCVACHAINGVGGHDAPAMDAHEMDQMMSPFDFAAKMWNHASGMIYAQEEAFGEQIELTGQDLADIIAFVHHDEVQHGFTEGNLTLEARSMMNHNHGEEPAHMEHSEELGHEHMMSD
jgi:cytochrome c